MKSQWKDKYLEICENTLQTPGGTVVKGTLLSHLKLHVSPVIQAGSGEPPMQVVENNDTNRNMKDKKPCTRISCLRRKRCMYRMDSRSKDSQNRSTDYYQKVIEKMPLYEELDILTSDGYLIPEELKENIRKARSESQQKLELDKFLKERGLPRRPDEDTKLLGNSSEGTYIAVSYRDSKRIAKISSNKMQNNIKVEARYINKPTATTTCDDVEDGDDENPYSVVRDLSLKTDYTPNYFLIAEEECEHGIPSKDCMECEHYYSKILSDSSYPSKEMPDGSENDNERFFSNSNTASLRGSFEYNIQDTIPETYLRKSVGMTTSNSTIGSTAKYEMDDEAFEKNEEFLGAEPFYYALEQIRGDALLKTGMEDGSNRGESLPGVHQKMDRNNNSSIENSQYTTYI